MARFLAAASRLDGFFAAAAGAGAAGAGAAAASPTARAVMSTGATVALRISAAGTAYSRSPSSCVEIKFQTSHAVDAMMTWRLISTRART